ncbi:hypothetical protein [Flavobacterium sp.]|uniref:hypothetical protein n=1 Tax=Flavobacterium sp. TaxID=239 RepID=UPI002C89D7DA|nr:hypothetical protein [Flavobacterium sp.]HSD07324.1 hypothetical protein [Flavobacterium sp.]
MKILIISYDFYPENKPNAYRWFNVAKRWKDAGMEVFVISANKNQFLSYEEIDGIKIYRSTEYFVGNIKYKHRENIKGENHFSKHNNSLGLEMLFKRGIKKVYDFTWSKFYWPDYSFLWYFSAVPLASKIIEEHKIDKLITVSWTFTSHIIGNKLKKRYPFLYWLADTIDIFSFNGKINNLFLYNKRNRSIEEKVFRNADCNTVLTEKIKQKYVDFFPEIQHKIAVNHNVYMPNSFDYEKENKQDSKTIKLLFLGTLTEEARSPKRMLAVFDRLIKKYSEYNFILDFYGEFTDTIDSFKEYQHLLDKSVFLNGFISRDEVNLAIKNSDVLLNVGNKNEFQEPSKLIEYMYSGKKILNFCSIEADTSLELVEKYPLKFNVYSDDKYDENLLTNIFDFLNSSEEIDKESLKIILKDYLLDEVADRYLRIIKNEQ